jgi:hypothetical protein
MPKTNHLANYANTDLPHEKYTRFNFEHFWSGPENYIDRLTSVGYTHAKTGNEEVNRSYLHYLNAIVPKTFYNHLSAYTFNIKGSYISSSYFLELQTLKYSILITNIKFTPYSDSDPNPNPNPKKINSIKPYVMFFFAEEFFNKTYYKLHMFIFEYPYREEDSSRLHCEYTYSHNKRLLSDFIEQKIQSTLKALHVKKSSIKGATIFL